MYCIKSSYKEKFPFLDCTKKIKNRQQRVKKGQIDTTRVGEGEDDSFRLETGEYWGGEGGTQGNFLF